MHFIARCVSNWIIIRISDKNSISTQNLIFRDFKEKTIVNNESSNIMRMMNSELNERATNPVLDLYPETSREAIDESNNWLYHTINDGVYRCGYAKGREVYDLAIDSLTASFDLIKKILGSQRYIAGDKFTEADIRLFVTLYR